MSDNIEVSQRAAWTCFHCGETFTTHGSARDHFGFDPSSNPACRIKVGAERGLVMALRKSEAELAEYVALLHDENLEAYRLLARAQSRHADSLQTAEELGYERGLADCRALNPGVGEGLREALGKGPTNERIAECKKAFAYKYFGDYEMSEGQRDAVNDAEDAMEALLAARAALAKSPPASVGEEPAVQIIRDLLFVATTSKGRGNMDAMHIQRARKFVEDNS